MSTPNDGGPAFPNEHTVHEPGKVFTLGDKIPHNGMTLRDYFAAKAMQSADWHLGIVFDGVTIAAKHNLARAEACYRIADAMIAARDTWT